MVKLKSGSLEERVLKLLSKKYPITEAQLQRELGINPKILDRTLKALQLRGIIMLDILPDKTFIRLVKGGFEFLGRKPTQRKAFRYKKEKKEETLERKKEDIMYG